PGLATLASATATTAAGPRAGGHRRLGLAGEEALEEARLLGDRRLHEGDAATAAELALRVVALPTAAADEVTRLDRPGGRLRGLLGLRLGRAGLLGAGLA